MFELYNKLAGNVSHKYLQLLPQFLLSQIFCLLFKYGEDKLTQWLDKTKFSLKCYSNLYKSNMSEEIIISVSICSSVLNLSPLSLSFIYDVFLHFSCFKSNVTMLQACAPRYVYFSINKRRMEPVGTCFTAMDSFSRFSEYSPCRTGKIIIIYALL